MHFCACARKLLWEIAKGSIAKEELPFTVYPNIIDLQEKNGVTLPTCYRTVVACRRFMTYIYEDIYAMVTLGRTNGYANPTTNFTIISRGIPETDVRKYSIRRPLLSSREVHFLVKYFSDIAIKATLHIV